MWRCSITDPLMSGVTAFGARFRRLVYDHNTSSPHFRGMSLRVAARSIRSPRPGASFELDLASRE
jgi:hypothetical protein